MVQAGAVSIERVDQPVATESAGAVLPLPLRAGDTTPDRPWPVRHLAPKISDYIAKMPPVWVEGQVLNFKKWNTLYFLTLRDTDLDMSLSVTAPATAIGKLADQVSDGSHIVVHARPRFHPKKGDLTFAADQVRLVGLGELLARIEHLKGVLAAEGLFDERRKKPLPFLPATIGLVVAQQGDAEHDVVSNARGRWAAAQFEIRRVTVQGPRAVPEVTAAIAELDANPRVEVIVVARGGGSFEDLLPFSNETLVRAVAAARTPVVSAIGHDVDTPLLDLVADHRASTPTDAAKAVVPDAAAERAAVAAARERGRRALAGRLHHERRRLVELRSRPVLTDKGAFVRGQREVVQALRERARRRVEGQLHRARDQTAHLRAQVRTLSPQSTLDRGYAIVQQADGAIVSDPAALEVGELLRVRVARGDFGARPVASAD
jgi:exodeoxyribonuclease VII large subunit